MKFIYIIILFTLMGCDYGTSRQQNTPDELKGIWSLVIKDQELKIITTIKFQFSDEVAYSCTSGNWKKIVVKSKKTIDKDFFPISDLLSYEIQNNHLVIGRNEICDDYIHLSGDLVENQTSGEYVAFGLYGAELYGSFTVQKIIPNGT